MTSHNGVRLSYPASGGGPGSHPHAVPAYNGTNYGYDSNGSLNARGTQYITYDARRLPVRLDDSGTTLWGAAYDGDGARRKRLDINGTVHYASDAYEVNQGNGTTNLTPVVT